MLEDLADRRSFKTVCHTGIIVRLLDALSRSADD